MAGAVLQAIRSSTRRALPAFSPARSLLPAFSPARSLRSADCSTRVEEMTAHGQNKITRVLFCGFDFPASHIYTQEYLKNYPDIQVDVVPLVDVPDAIGRYHMCIVKICRLDSKVIASAAEMKLIMQFGVGLEGVDVDAATRRNIKVARIPGSICGNSVSCAEMAIYLMLGLLRKQKEMEIAVKQKYVGIPTGETLLGKTVFILGFGAIGVDLAKRLRPFGVKIIATKRKWPSDSLELNGMRDMFGTFGTTGSQSAIFHDLVDQKGGPENIYEFAGQSDIVVPCLTLNAETAGIVDDKFLSSMRKGGLLVNIARGGILDYKSVLHHLESGHLGGLAIDVAWTEPFDPEDPILKYPNVLITPHVAGVTEISYRKMAKVVGDCALQLHSGCPITGIEFVN